MQVHGFLLDTRQAANARTDGTAGPALFLFGHVGEAGILQRLSGGVDAENNERVDLPLDLAIHALVGIESPGMVLVLHFAGNGALLVRRIKPRDLPGTGLGRDEIAPAGFDIAAQRRYEAQSGDYDTTHILLLRQAA